MPKTPTGAKQPYKGPPDLASPWTVIFAVLMAADGLFMVWQPALIVIGLFLGLTLVAAFFRWRDQLRWSRTGYGIQRKL